MNEATKTEVIYDADETQRIPVGDGVFAVVKPYTDEKFLKVRQEFAELVNESLQRGEDQEVTQEEIKQALVRDVKLADELIENLEGYPDLPGDWKELLSVEDKQAIIRKALNFVIDEAESEFVLGKTVVLTACYFNGKVANQRHILRKKTIDDSSAYSHLVTKQYKPVKIKKFGQKDAFEFILQDQAKAALYDSMIESPEGFQNNKVPLRVKVLVIDHIFSVLDGKK